MAPPNYTRRDLLAASTATVVLAGCLDGDGAEPTAPDTDTTPPTDGPATSTATADPTAEPTASETETAIPVDEEAAAAFIEDARVAIQSAFDELAADDTDHDALRGHVGDATDALDDAEARATADQRSQITALRDVTSYLATVTDADAALANGIGDLQTGLDAYWRARDYYFAGDHTTEAFESAASEFDAAATSFDENATRFDDARSTFEDARAQLQSLDGTVVSSFENVTYEGQQGTLSGGTQIAATLTVFTLGHANGAVAWTQTSQGLAFATNENWASAKSTFEDAKSPFQTATTHYDDTDRELLYEVLPFLEDWFAPVICEIELGVDMLDHFVASMEAAIDGDQDTHEAEANAGLDIHSECHD